MEIYIRRYQPRDRQRLLEITTEVFAPVSISAAIERKLGVLNGVGWQQRKRADVSADFETNPGGTFVAETGGETVGYVTTDTDQETQTGHIRNMAVAARHQGKGVGKALLDAALDYFEAEGMMYSQIETLACNERGQHFYQQAGYQEVARKIYYCMHISDRKHV